MIDIAYMKNLEGCLQRIFRELDQLADSRNDEIRRMKNLMTDCLAEAGADIRIVERECEDGALSEVESLFMDLSGVDDPEKLTKLAEKEVKKDLENEDAFNKRLEELRAKSRPLINALMEMTEVKYLGAKGANVRRTRFYIVRPDGLYCGDVSVDYGKLRIGELEKSPYPVENVSDGVLRGFSPKLLPVHFQAYLVTNPSNMPPADNLFAYVVDFSTYW